MIATAILCIAYGRGAPLPLSLTSPPPTPRWYSPPTTRGFYRVAASLAWLPRGARLGLARQLGRLAPRWMPLERAAVRNTLARVTGATESRLEALTVATFADFAMCFSDLVSTNRQPMARLVSQVDTAAGAERVARLGKGSSAQRPCRQLGLAGRLLADAPPGPRTSWWRKRRPASWKRGCAGKAAAACASSPALDRHLAGAGRRAPAGRGGGRAGDRALGTRGDVLIPFFGKARRLPSGHSSSPAPSGVPVVPAFCLLGADHRYTSRSVSLSASRARRGGGRPRLGRDARGGRAGGPDPVFNS